MVFLTLVVLSACPGPVDDATTFPLGRSTAFAPAPAGLVLRADAGVVGPNAPPAVASTYESRVFDFGAPITLDSIRLVTPFPSGRQLPFNGVREMSSPMGAANMMGNTLLLPLDEPAGISVADRSGVGASGVFDGGVTLGVPGVVGSAATFDGGCLVFADSPSLNPTSTLTLAAWIRPRGLDGVAPHGIFSKRADYLQQSQFTFFLWLGDTLWVDLDTENDRFSGTRPLVNDRWTHVAMVYDGRLDAGVRVRVFVDGTLDIVAPETSSTLPPQPVPLSLGCLPNPSGGTDQTFDGELDEVASWNRALSDSEVNALYARGSSRHVLEARACMTPGCLGPSGFTPVSTDGGLSLPATRYFQYRLQGIAPVGALEWASVTEVRLDQVCPADGGSTSDGGSTTDAGAVDAGTPVDAGTSADGGTNADVGTSDGGVVMDAGSTMSPDAGVDADAGLDTPADAGLTAPGSFAWAARARLHRALLSS